jgi:hypothetical protein
MVASKIQVTYSDTNQVFGYLTVNRPTFGQYIKSLGSCEMGMWDDSDLKPRGDVKPGGTISYNAAGDTPLFRLGDFKAGALDDSWPPGSTGKGHTFGNVRPLAWKVTAILDSD